MPDIIQNHVYSYELKQKKSINYL